MPDDPVSRRTALRLGCGILAFGLSGCSGDNAPTGEAVTPTTSSSTDTDTPGETATPGQTPTRTDTTETTPDGGTQTDERTQTDESTEETDAKGTDDLADEVTARRVASGFTSPVGLEIPQSGRRFIVDQSGQIYLQDDEGVHSDPYLDVSGKMVDVSGYSERGLLGLAFHPEFDDNGRFFVRYSSPSREGTPDNYSHTFVLSEFRADPTASRAEPDSERTILEIPQPQGNHNAGAVAFGPDGYLYVATGDGGAANDQGTGHVSDWYDAVDGGNGQDVTENLLGSILRIDVDDESDGRNYAIPDDNPLVGTNGLDEQYAWGFRNPWRMSFGPDGRLFAGDVGQNSWEEVDVVEKGGNYGWNVREGTHCFSADECPSESPRGRTLRDPVIEYPTGGDDPVSGRAVIGGYLYDGDDVPGLAGQYVFADWQADGDLFAAQECNGELWPTRVVSVDSDETFGPNVLAFGRNPSGELFVCTTASGQVSGSTGAVFRLGVEG